MSNRIDSTGTYLGTIVEHSLGETKNGFPQFIVRVKADEKYVADTDGLAHFKLTEPQYVDWSSFDEEQLGYLVLFKSKDQLDDSTKLLNYEQLQLATGWEGTSFDDLNNGKFVGKKILFRVEENEYQGKVSLQMNWIDSVDAAPERSLKSLDVNKVKGLNALLKTTVKKSPAPVAAKPAKPGKPAVSPTTAAPAPSTPTAAAAPKTAPKAPKAPKAPPASAPATPELTKTEAWDALLASPAAGEVEDSEIETAWLTASTEVLADRTEDKATSADWAAIRDSAIAKLVK